MAAAVELLLLFGACGPGLTAPPWFDNITTNLFKSPGDILLGGLFPINLLTSNLSGREQPDDSRCESLDHFGLGLALVMKYTVDEINSDQTLLPGVRLGFEIFDTCGQAPVKGKSTVSFLTEKSIGDLAVECDYTDYEPKVAAVIGPLTSEMNSVIGQLLGFFQIPQISYGATSVEFSDKQLYPSFLRTVSDDRWQAEMVVLLLRRFGWNWVAAVGTDEVYGRQGLREFSLVAANMSICVAYEGLIPVYGDTEKVVKMILDNIRATRVGVVVMFSLPAPTAVFFQEVVRRNMSGVWIASTAWALDNRVVSVADIHTVGTILGITDQTHTLDLFTAYAGELFTKISEEMQDNAPSDFNPKKTHPNYPCPQCWSLSPENMSLVTDPNLQSKTSSVYTAIYSVAHALHTMLNCTKSRCMWGSDSKIYPWQLLKVLKNVDFALNGVQIQFDSSGNPNIGFNLVTWVWENRSWNFVEVGSFNQRLSINKTLLQWHTNNSEVPQSTCSAACEAGQVPRVKGFHACCFDCISCKAGTFQATNEDVQCTHCPKGQWSPSRSTSCTEPTFDFLSWNQPETVGMMVGGVVLLMCHGSVGILFLKYRGTPLVRASGGSLGGVALCSLVGGCLSLLLFLGRPGNLVCRLQLPLTSFFPTVALSSITVISLQIFYVNEFPLKAASHLDTMRRLGCWLMLACCFVQVGFCGWFVSEAPLLSEYLAQMNINFVRGYLSCPSEPISGFALMQGFSGALAIMSFMCTFMAARPVRQYNLARDITFSTLAYSVIWVTFIPIYIGLRSNLKSMFHVCFSLLSNLGLVSAYYFPKCYLLLRKPELNTPDYFCTFLEGAPPPTQEEEPNPTPQPDQELEPPSHAQQKRINTSSL